MQFTEFGDFSIGRQTSPPTPLLSKERADKAQFYRGEVRFYLLAFDFLSAPDYKVYVKSSTSIPGTKLPPSWRLSYVPTSGINS